MKKLLLLMIISVLSFAQMEFSNPKPTFDHPRKWVIQLKTSDLKIVNHTLGAIYNVLKIYPSETLNIEVVAYGHGMRVLRKDYDKNTLNRIKSLMEYDVEFVGCLNTMETMHWGKKEFIDDITYTQAGVAELIEKTAGGWVNITPY